MIPPHLSYTERSTSFARVLYDTHILFTQQNQLRLLPPRRLNKHSLPLPHSRQTRLNHNLPIDDLPIPPLQVLQPRRLHPLLSQILLPFGGQHPLLGKLKPLLGRMVPEVKRHVFEGVGCVFCFCNQTLDGFAEEALVLRLCVELFGGEFDEVGGGVVARAGEFD